MLHHVFSPSCSYLSLLGLHVEEYKVEKKDARNCTWSHVHIHSRSPKVKKRTGPNSFGCLSVSCELRCVDSVMQMIFLWWRGTRIWRGVLYFLGGSWLQKCHQMGKMDQKLINHQKAKKLLVGNCSKILLLKSVSNSTEHREVVIRFGEWNSLARCNLLRVQTN